MSEPTHAQLVKKAIKWLWSQRCVVVISEMAGSGQEPDAIGWHPGYSILIECKASRSDFLADKHKRYRRFSESMGDQRYYLAPKGTIKSEELPEGWGLLVPSGNGVRIVVQSRYIPNKDCHSEIHLLLSAICRVRGKAGKHVSVRFYQYHTGCRATLGIIPEHSELGIEVSDK